MLAYRAAPRVAVNRNISTGEGLEKAVNTIISDKKIGDDLVTPAPHVIYEAGSFITILPGFEAPSFLFLSGD